MSDQEAKKADEKAFQAECEVVMGVLESVHDTIKPRICQCEVIWGVDPECECHLEDTREADRVYLAEYVLVTHWIMPNGDRGTTVHNTPGAPTHHTLGLLQEAIEG